MLCVIFRWITYNKIIKSALGDIFLNSEYYNVRMACLLVFLLMYLRGVPYTKWNIPKWSVMFVLCGQLVQQALDNLTTFEGGVLESNPWLASNLR